MPKECQLKPESLDKCRFYHSPDPPKSPLRRGTFTPPFPPFLRGARGDLDLIVKQQSLTGFDLVVDTYGHCRVLIFGINSDAAGFDITSYCIRTDAQELKKTGFSVYDRHFNR